MTLAEIVRAAAERSPDAVALRAPDATLTYRELDRASDRAANALAALGVRRGDRVGIWLEKSAAAVVMMQGTLRLGAAYVPLDPLSPIARVAKIARGCEARVVVTSADRRMSVKNEIPIARCLVAADTTGGSGWRFLEDESETPRPDPALADDELAYILYTSGSTGMPKGVCISQRNALAFIEWAHAEIAPTAEDRFGNHAPFFFDLSVLDLYVAFLAGASVSIVPEALAYAPGKLVEILVRDRISIWYSVPSALMLMMERGELIPRAEQLSLRTILFAGEPFPIKHLRKLRTAFSHARFLNLYGPTETNVCTFYEVHDIPDDRTEPVPIGVACCGDRAWLEPVPGYSTEGDEPTGELVIEGPTVMLGYWGQMPQKGRPYRTGDIVRLQRDGNYAYLGRQDSMVKVRGRRIELGEIESALMEHPAIREAAVLVCGEGAHAQLIAFLAHGSDELSLLDIKRHCSERLPRYMIVDDVHYMQELPRTRNGKVDRQSLKQLLKDRGK